MNKNKYVLSSHGSQLYSKKYPYQVQELKSNQDVYFYTQIGKSCSVPNAAPYFICKGEYSGYSKKYSQKIPDLFLWPLYPDMDIIVV